VLDKPMARKRERHSAPTGSMRPSDLLSYNELADTTKAIRSATYINKKLPSKNEKLTSKERKS
jgi:hypothetical protein